MISHNHLCSFTISGSGSSDGHAGRVRPGEYSQGLRYSVCAEHDGQLCTDLQPLAKHPRRRSYEFTGVHIAFFNH